MTIVFSFEPQDTSFVNEPTFLRVSQEGMLFSLEISCPPQYEVSFESFRTALYVWLDKRSQDQGGTDSKIWICNGLRISNDGETVRQTFEYTSSVPANLGALISCSSEEGTVDSTKTYYSSPISFISKGCVVAVKNCKNVLISNCVVDGVDCGIDVTGSKAGVENSEIALQASVVPDSYAPFIKKDSMSKVNITNVICTDVRSQA